jgi:hypothetical protein
LRATIAKKAGTTLCGTLQRITRRVRLQWIRATIFDEYTYNMFKREWEA